MTPRRIRERLVAARFRPVARIGRCRLRLRAMDRAPYPAHEPKAVAADAFERGLMAVGRANEGTRLRDDAGALGHGSIFAFQSASSNELSGRVRQAPSTGNLNMA